MKIPDIMRELIASTFYDKEVTLYDVTDSVDSEGWARKSTPVANGTFLGNVRFDKLDKIQRDYGIDDVISAAITTDAVVENEQIIGYLGKFHKVIRSIPEDSHRLLITQVWEDNSIDDLSV